MKTLFKTVLSLMITASAATSFADVSTQYKQACIEKFGRNAAATVEKNHLETLKSGISLRLRVAYRESEIVLNFSDVTHTIITVDGRKFIASSVNAGANSIKVQTPVPFSKINYVDMTAKAETNSIGNVTKVTCIAQTTTTLLDGTEVTHYRALSVAPVRIDNGFEFGEVHMYTSAWNNIGDL